jgi:predicted Zn-dependent protease
VLAAAGYSTAGMAGMFEKLDVATRLNDNGGFPYLRSHPLTVDRISEARNRTLLSGAAPRPPTLEHALMQARARVLMDDSAQGLQRLNGASSSPLASDRVGALYAGALAASQLQDHARAEALAEEALDWRAPPARANRVPNARCCCCRRNCTSHGANRRQP